MNAQTKHQTKHAYYHTEIDCGLLLTQIQLMCTYLTKAEYKELQEVPDPYFGGEEGFEKVTSHFKPSVLLLVR